MMVSPLLPIMVPTITGIRTYVSSREVLLSEKYKITINIRRDDKDQIMRVGLQIFQRNTIDSLKMARFHVNFEDEFGSDHGGLSREYFFLFAKYLFEGENSFIKFDKTLGYYRFKTSLPEPKEIFAILGKIIGFYTFKSMPIGVPFVPSFYKILLDIPLKATDYENDDPQTYLNLISLKGMRDSELDGMELYFPNNKERKVTIENVDDYINENAIYLMHGFAETEFSIIKDNFKQFVKTNKWNPTSLKKLLTGEMDYANIKRVLQNSVRLDKYDKSDSTIKHLFRFNILELPPYPTYKVLKQKIDIAIEFAHHYGFI
ncbi:hypothetical protein ROZALSC1DRAFT_28113 [Rozella allomycis CSF55]|uniref:HECT-type E3 ubiquitin transferase n=1 Tax=Rozella allomycis (strain CSF55) TaxID=988480 RepID=A0A4P9YLM6_ROZAC|nr:hypothetical protein ROZALSC1DRAFT_28113 [Rozella allomycis CSF55]